jgi:hypothetical protein
MTTAMNSAWLRESLHETGNDWLLEYWGDQAERNLAKTSSQLRAFTRDYKKRFGKTPDLPGMVAANPMKASAFLQNDTLQASREMQVMAWRILEGCEVTAVTFQYKEGTESLLRVVLRTLLGESEEYVSRQTSDFRILRHFGLTGVAGQHALQGYYAFRGVR